MHPLLKLENRCMTKLAGGETVYGLFLLSGNSMVAETISTLPIDFLVIDMEASPVTKEGAMHILQALNGSDVTPIIRVSTLERSIIEHALDAGAHGVLVPKVDTPQQASEVVEAAFYPEKGRRGINPVRASGYFSNVPAYLRGANDRTMCIVQIESVEAVERANEIANVEGVDALFIGAADLACAYGQPGDVTGPAMDQARKIVLQACKQAGKTPGIFAYSTDLAAQYTSEGFKLVAIGNDIKAIRESVMTALEQIRAR